jgi:hypothetical protein
MTLHLAPGFDMSDDAVTETFAILAKKRVGKSNAAVVMADEMYDQGIPWAPSTRKVTGGAFAAQATAAACRFWSSAASTRTSPSSPAPAAWSRT